jgi:hypothetical protein
MIELELALLSCAQAATASRCPGFKVGGYAIRLPQTVGKSGMAAEDAVTASQLARLRRVERRAVSPGLCNKPGNGRIAAGATVLMLIRKMAD